MVARYLSHRFDGYKTLVDERRLHFGNFSKEMALDFFAGCLGGCAGVMVGHPLDTVKVHIQMQHARYAGMMDCMRKLMAKEGARGLFKGMSSPLLGVAGINAVIFGIYGNTQRQFNDPNALWTHFIAGSAAGLAQSLLASPIELAKLRMQTANENLPLTACIRRIHQQEGLRGLFRGLNITIMRDVPAFASYFITYEYLARHDGGHANTATLLAAGGLAGVTSWAITYPIDTIKTRMQCDAANQYRNSFDCLLKSLRQDGAASLFRGLSPALVRAFPTNAAIFTVVTWTIRLCENGMEFDLVLLPNYA